MTLYLLDTNVLSRLARGGDVHLDRMIRSRDNLCRVSAISWYELAYGAARMRAQERSTRKLAFLQELFPDTEPFNTEASKCAAYVRVALETMRPNAQPIGPYDLLLAGHALSLSAVFVTHNTAEFSRVPGLNIEDWQTI